MSDGRPEAILHKVLLLEARQDYRNRAASGGLASFARYLGERKASSTCAAAADVLAHYDDAPASERKHLVRQALELLSDGHTRSSNHRGPEVTTTANATQMARTYPEAAATQLSQPAPHRRRDPSPAARPRRSAADRLTNITVDSSLAEVPGVRSDMRAILARVGVETVRDLVFYFPRDHYDYRESHRISRLRYGEKTTLVGIIDDVQNRYPRRGLTVTTAVIRDESGSVAVRWFNQPYLSRQLTVGRRIAITGEADLFNGRTIFVPRDYEWADEGSLTHGGRLVPIYPLTRGLYQKPLRGLIHRILPIACSLLVDYLPAEISVQHALMPLRDAVFQYHFPDDEPARARAQRRLAFDELFAIQLGLTLRKRDWRESAPGPAVAVADTALDGFIATLPFALTNAQRRVIDEIRRDMAEGRPMARLLQGDVGAGKTVVAACALWMTVQAGYQGALMAPTEILAEQHERTARAFLERTGARVALLVGSTPAKRKATIREAAARAEIDVLVGTHALLQEGVSMPALGLAVIDEQHRFGVEQRASLRQKGSNPHVLAMTATPIPRTLALTIYGDLDISTLDELPPGRQPIETEWVPTAARAYARVREEVARGHQAFVICPVIDESADADVKSALAEHASVQKSVFADLNVGLLHGRLRPAEKERILTAFRRGEFHVLVATSVVEVGIDIPNATVMVIRDAHRFGLAQLHQFRGRIGRGGERSYCLLVSGVDEGSARERLSAILHTQDGFALAEEDLRLRGPGEFWGTRQSGLPQLRVAQLGDVATVRVARAAAEMVAASDPDLSLSHHRALREHVERFWSRGTDVT